MFFCIVCMFLMRCMYIYVCVYVYIYIYIYIYKVRRRNNRKVTKIELNVGKNSGSYHKVIRQKSAKQGSRT